eukprot:TRINITY_DN10242_c0_g1_i1.p5 TRINITY_DN10242_c0_g1~~TRINITY_DN10242_c0_g1_i1.p5  ORF type:complete len:107 (-),score=11.76 TRINITY_DN10242_c0_g1_i1:28-348(-)
MVFKFAQLYQGILAYFELRKLSYEEETKETKEAEETEETEDETKDKTKDETEVKKKKKGVIVGTFEYAVVGSSVAGEQPDYGLHNVRLTEQHQPQPKICMGLIKQS